MFPLEEGEAKRSRNLEMGKLRECSGDSKFLIPGHGGVWRQQ